RAARRRPARESVLAAAARGDRAALRRCQPVAGAADILGASETPSARGVQARAGEAVDDRPHQFRELEVVAEQDAAPRREVRPLGEELAHLLLRLRLTPQEAETGGAHHRPPEHDRVPEFEGDLAGPFDVAPADAVRPYPEQ